MKLFKPYVPASDGNLAVWAGTYKEKLGLLGPDLGLSAAEVLAQQNLAQEIIDKITRLDLKKAELKEAASSKTLVKAANLQQIRNMAARIKTLVAYTPNIGKELGIVSKEQLIDFSALQPELSITPFPGYVSISFNKQRMFGVNLYSRVKGEQQWHFLGGVKAAPFYDETALAEEGRPELREYRGVCFDGLEEVGLPSDIVTVIYGG